MKEVSFMKGRIYDKLCEIDDTGRAEALSSKPLFSCSQCGAQAHDASSVCQPIKLSSGT